MKMSEYLELKAEIKHLKLVLFHNGFMPELENLDKLSFDIFKNMEKYSLEELDVELDTYRRITKDLDPWITKGKKGKPLLYD